MGLGTADAGAPGASRVEAVSLRRTVRVRKRFERRIWDTAAGVLLVKEAGGFITDYRGSDRSFERREYLAANGELHSKLHKLVAGALR